MNNNKIPSTDPPSTSDLFHPSPSPQSHRRNSNNKGQYTLGVTLGEGAFAKVKLATHNPTQEKIAIKIINKSHLLKEEKDVVRIKKEILILKKIRHKNIIQLYEIMESKSSLYIVMEYCEGKELYEHIVQKKRLTEEETCRFFQQIINAVEYLHDQGIIHRDLKPENILLDDKMNIKISDFGLSTFFTKGHLLSTPCGTPSYAPPEMLRGDQYNGESSDVWSCGIILYAMLCGKLPFAESREDVICKKIIDKDYVIPDFVPKQAKELINLILNVNSKERLTIDQIKRHPWFNFVHADLRPGIALGKQTPPIDENILLKVQSYGYDINKCRQNLQNNKFDSLTSVYYLLLKQYIKQGGKSVSDLSSDDYLRFIINLNDINGKILMAKTNGASGDKRDTITHTKAKISENNSPYSRKVEAKIISKFHSNYILPATATNSNMQINNTDTFKDSFVSSFVSTKKPKGSKAKLRLPQPQVAISSNVSSPAITPLSASDVTNKQLHLAKHALYKKKRQELTKLKKSQGASEAINKQHQTECSTNSNNGLSCTNPQLNPIGNEIDEDEDLLFEEELNNIDSMSKNVNILQYIAQKLIGNPFYGSFDISTMSSRKNTLENKLKLKEESKEDKCTINNYPSNSDYEMIIKDEIEEEEDIGDEDGDEFMKNNINTNFMSKIKGNINNSDTKPPEEIEVTRHKKSIKHSFIKKQEVFIYDYSEKNNNNTHNSHNHNNEHHNKFLDISTTQLESSVERSISVNKDLRGYSLSPEKNTVSKSSKEDIAKHNHNAGNNLHHNRELKKSRQGFEGKKKNKINYNEIQRCESNSNNNGYITLTVANNNKKYTVHAVKPTQSGVKGEKTLSVTSKHTTNTNNEHSTDNLFKSANNNNNNNDTDVSEINNKTIIETTSRANIAKINNFLPLNSNNNIIIKQEKATNATKKRTTNNQCKSDLASRDKLIPHPKKEKEKESVEILFDKSVKHTRTGSANESILKNNMLESKIKINLNEINDSKAFNSICFHEVKDTYDAIKIYKGPIDLICCCTMPPSLLYTFLLNLFKAERFSCVKLSSTQLKCSKSLLSFECEVMILESSRNSQLKTSYAKFRFKQGDVLVYRKILASIGQSLQALE